MAQFHFDQLPDNALLRDLKARGLRLPKLAVADGHLGLWAALGELHPSGEEQRCWNHKIVNVLDDLPKKVQPQAAELLKAMPYAETQAECERLRDAFASRYGKTDPNRLRKNEWMVVGGGFAPPFCLARR